MTSRGSIAHHIPGLGFALCSQDQKLCRLHHRKRQNVRCWERSLTAQVFTMLRCAGSKQRAHLRLGVVVMHGAVEGVHGGEAA